MDAQPSWLLLHGVPLAPTVWDEVARALGGKVVCPDLRRPASDVAPHIVAGHIIRELRAEWGGRRWRVVGHSYGGQVALELALAAPELVSTLALLCTRDSPFGQFHAAAQQLRLGESLAVDDALARWFRPGELADDQRLVRYARASLLEADRGRWAATLDAIADFDVTGRLATIAAPTALLAAEYDPVSDPSTMALMAQRLPDATLTVAGEAAHLSPFLEPQRIARYLTTGEW